MKGRLPGRGPELAEVREVLVAYVPDPLGAALRGDCVYRGLGVFVPEQSLRAEGSRVDDDPLEAALALWLDDEVKKQHRRDSRKHARCLR
jgi:hypothetical protein